MTKWLSGVGKLAHALVPYLALALALSGRPEAAAVLQAAVPPDASARPLVVQSAVVAPRPTDN